MSAKTKTLTHRASTSDGNSKSSSSSRRGFPESRVQVVLMRPSRRPVWRWDLAGDVVASGLRAPRTVLDPVLAEAIRFRRVLEGATTTAKLATLVRRYPDHFAAWEVHERNDLARWRVEARMLAGQSSDEIAAAEGLTSTSVAAYESMFFDVRSRLQAKLWVFASAIGPRYAERLEARDAGVVLKAFSYMCGPKLLELLLATVVDERGRLLPLSLRSLDTQAGRLAAWAQFAVAALTGPADLTRLQELSRIPGLIHDSERASAAKSATAEPIWADLSTSPADLVAEIHDAEADTPQEVDRQRAQEASASDKSREVGEAA